jgi:hypothetical protein
MRTPKGYYRIEYDAGQLGWVVYTGMWAVRKTYAEGFVARHTMSYPSNPIRIRDHEGHIIYEHRGNSTPYYNANTKYEETDDYPYYRRAQ